LDLRQCIEDGCFSGTVWTKEQVESVKREFKIDHAPKVIDIDTLEHQLNPPQKQYFDFGNRQGSYEHKITRHGPSRPRNPAGMISILQEKPAKWH
jgi:hypothetical protein